VPRRPTGDRAIQRATGLGVIAVVRGKRGPFEGQKRASGRGGEVEERCEGWGRRRGVGESGGPARKHVPVLERRSVRRIVTDPAKMFPDPESCDPSLWTFDTIMPSQQDIQDETDGASVPVDFFDGQVPADVETGRVAEWEEDEPQEQQQQLADSTDTPWLNASASSMDLPSSQTQIHPTFDPTLQMDEFLGFVPPESEDTGMSSATLDVLAFDVGLDDRLSRDSGLRTPPPPSLDNDPTEQQPDETLNSDKLFSECNFKKGTSGLSERGRGAFAAAIICFLERLEAASGHVNAIRGGTYVDRWQLNRMPGRTDALFHFVNAVLVSMLGLKAFSSWRALARSLGDTRDYLPPRHWRCLELKGGGVSEATKQPWQSYQARAGHFDMLAEELETFMLSCGDLLPPMSSLDSHTEGASPSTPRGSQSRQEQFALKRMTTLTMAAVRSAKDVNEIGRPGPPEGYTTKAEVVASLEQIWLQVLTVCPKIAPSPPSTRRRAAPSASRKPSGSGIAKGRIPKPVTGPSGASKGKNKSKTSSQAATTTAAAAAAAAAAAEAGPGKGAGAVGVGGAGGVRVKAEAKARAKASAGGAGAASAGGGRRLGAAAGPATKSRSGRTVTKPSWMQGDSAFITGKVMHEVLHHPNLKAPAAKKRRRSRGAVGAAAAAAMFG
jgi:hypothetical protein